MNGLPSRVEIFGKLLLMLVLSALGTDLQAQNRDVRAERLILDDNGSDGTQNTILIQASDSLSQNIVITVPDPGVAGAEFLLVPPGTSGAWLLGGNVGTTPGTDFLGTGDATALHLYVNGGNDNSLILNPNGSIQRETAGNARGIDAVDLQRNRFGDPSEAADGVIMVASGNQSTIAGGTFNIASREYATVGGGSVNTASNTASVVSGGNGNIASGYGTVVAGGVLNVAAGTVSAVLGGFGNSASGNYSTILGGRYLTLLGTGSIGFLANNGSTTRRMIVSDDNSAVFANTDLWLANNVNAASRLRFYEANNAADSFPTSTTFYTSFEAGDQSQDINYILPTTLPTTNGQVLTSDTNGVMSWITSSSGSTLSSSWSLTGNSGTTPGTDFLGTIDSVALHIRTNNTVRLIFNINGSIQRDNVGDSRGDGAIDFQSIRVSGTQVASGGQSFIGGGERNTASALQAIVGGGFGNTASGSNSTVGGGWGNTASGYRSIVSGGGGNIASNDHSAVAGGSANTTSGKFAVIAGGEQNSASGIHSTVGGGLEDTASGIRSMVGGGWRNMASGQYSTVSGGTFNTASGNQSTIAGGSDNVASGTDATVGGGALNVASGTRSTVGGGVADSATGSSSTIAGGLSNTAAGDYTAIPGGRGLTLDASADDSFGFLGGNTAMTISAPEVAVFGNTDLWLANNNSTASQIRFYEAYNTSGAFPNGTNYSSFQAQAQTADIEYILPAAAGTVGQQLTISAVAGTQVTLNWAAASDRAKKTNFQTLSGESILQKFHTFDLGTWRYDPSIDPKGTRHYGIMAQDFHAAFGNDGIGEIGTDTTVMNLDLHGVSYLAIQGLEQRTAEQAETIQEQAGHIEQLEAKVESLQEQINALRRILED